MKITFLNPIIIPVLLFSMALSAQVKISNNSWKQANLSPQEKKNLQLVLHFVEEGLGRAKMEVFDECLSNDLTVYTGLKVSGPINGINEYKMIFETFATAWPVTEFIIDEAFATDDKVVIRFQAIAYFDKEYYGLKPTKQIINMKEVHFITVKNNKIVNNIVSGTNFPFEYIMYPLLKKDVIGNLPIYKD